MLPVSRFAPIGKPSSATRIAVSSGRWRYAQWIVQSSSEDRAAAPDEPGDVPRQQRPRREQRQHPRRVDVRQERAGRVVRVAAAEPDPDRRPSTPGRRRRPARRGRRCRPRGSPNVMISSVIARIRRRSWSRDTSRRSARRMDASAAPRRLSSRSPSRPPRPRSATPARRHRRGILPRRRSAARRRGRRRRRLRRLHPVRRSVGSARRSPS